jgi:uncharacterized protein YutE (UPF0331/DUF86 family)
MRLDLYAEETRRLASELGGVLAEVRQLLQAQHTLSKLEQSGVLHAIQVLTENSIGKAKVILKSQGQTVPVSAYDAFSKLPKPYLYTFKPPWTSGTYCKPRLAQSQGLPLV